MKNRKLKSLTRSMVEVLVRELPAPTVKVLTPKKYKKDKYKKNFEDY